MKSHEDKSILSIYMYLVPRQEWHKDEAQNGKRGNADQNQGANC